MLPGFVVKDARLLQPLVGCSGRVVELRSPCSRAALPDQFAHGPQEVQLQAQERVQPLQRLKGGLGVVAVVADAATYAEPVALFHPRLVVLAIAATACEADPVLLAPSVQGLVDDLRSVVGV